MSAPLFDGSRYRPKPVPPGPLDRPAEVAHVVRPPKAPRSSLPRQGKKHRAKQGARFAEQAERCREARCACCDAPPPCDPHHWPTVARGGLDADTCPLCPSCHSVFHDVAGSPEKFLELMGCDVLAEIKKMRKKPDHSCERYAALREDGTPGREVSVYVCQRCGAAIPDAQEGGDE